MLLKDLTGMVFGRLTVVRHAGTNAKGVNMWLCHCECGKEKIVRGDALRYGLTKSCGCFAHETRVATGKKSVGRTSPRLEDLTGKVFNFLTVLERAENSFGKARWKCKCICGKETFVVTSKLKSGRTISCGCMGLYRATQAKIKHGDALYRKSNRLYSVWSAMKRRCYNPHVDAYKYYGGKGVVICQDWHDYANFKAWALNNGYADNLTIDRKNPDGNYEPSNCQWITASENIARAKRIPENIRLEAENMLRQGYRCIDVINKLGISRPTVSRINAELGLAKPRKKKPR